MRKAINRVLKLYCKFRLKSKLPGIESKLSQYGTASETTGTQWITLWMAVSEIFKHKPLNILESGTGASTIVLAEAIRVLQRQDSRYKAQIISMESVQKWYQIAKENLPEDYSDIVQIVYGPRERIELSIFRGYVHQNIPDRPYDFFFIDGPNFEDQHGTTFCADMLFVAQRTGERKVRGVIDGRTSSAFVLQTLFGVSSARYFIPNMACRFHFNSGRLHTSFKSTDFSNGLTGRLTLKM